MDNNTIQITVAGIAAGAAIIAAVFSLIGGVVGALIGASAARRNKITEVFFERKYEASLQLLKELDDLNAQTDAFDVQTHFPSADVVYFLSSDKASILIEEYIEHLVELHIILHDYRIHMNNGKENKRETLDSLAQCHRDLATTKDALKTVLKKELYDVGAKGRARML